MFITTISITAKIGKTVDVHQQKDKPMYSHSGQARHVRKPSETHMGALRNTMWLKEIWPEEYSLHFHDILLQAKLIYSRENPEQALPLRGRKGAGADGGQEYEGTFWSDSKPWYVRMTCQNTECLPKIYAVHLSRYCLKRKQTVPPSE